MTLATLAEVLQPALKNGYAVGGLVTLGWEDMRAYVAAAEAENVPVILQAGPGCREHTPLPILGKMFRYLAESASVPVVAHLDHGYTFDECKEALDSGFTSLMFDGSRKPLNQNIDETAAIAEMAHAAGISCEGEIGFVGYSGGEGSNGTDPEEEHEQRQHTCSRNAQCQKAYPQCQSLQKCHAYHPVRDRADSGDNQRLNLVAPFMVGKGAQQLPTSVRTRCHVGHHKPCDQ